MIQQHYGQNSILNELHVPRPQFFEYLTVPTSWIKPSIFGGR